MTIPGVSRHARERMAERHGRDLTRDEWLALVADILEGRSVLLHGMPPDGSGECHLCQVAGVPVRVMWQPMAGLVTTVLGDADSKVAAVANAKRGRIRQSLYAGGGWRRGKRKALRTVWQ